MFTLVISLHIKREPPSSFSLNLEQLASAKIAIINRSFLAVSNSQTRSAVRMNNTLVEEWPIS